MSFSPVLCTPCMGVLRHPFGMSFCLSWTGISCEPNYTNLCCIFSCNTIFHVPSPKMTWYQFCYLMWKIIQWAQQAYKSPYARHLASLISKSVGSLALIFTWCPRLLLSSTFPNSLSSTFIYIYSMSLLVFVFLRVFHSFLPYVGTCLNCPYGTSLDTCKSFNE